MRKSNQGWKVAQIAKHFNWAQSTVRQAIHRWQQEGLGGLWDEPRPGRQRQWQEEDMVYIEQSLEQEQRTKSSPQLLEKLKRERNVHLSQSHLRRVLKKRALDGNAHAKVTTISKTRMSVSASNLDLDFLELAAAAGDISLKYLDESGFCFWSAVSYTWFKVGFQKRLEQTQRRGRRISILGLHRTRSEF